MVGGVSGFVAMHGALDRRRQKHHDDRAQIEDHAVVSVRERWHVERRAGDVDARDSQN